jgi:ribosomal protein S18 acetylase RimI-like enzyme
MRDSTGSRHIAAMPAAAGPDGHLLEYLAMLGEPPRPERGIVPWSEWVDAEHDDMRVRVEHHTGPRDALRPLFAEAEDSARALDAYLDAGELLVAIVQEEVVGHLQLVEAATGDAGEIKNMAVERDHRRRGIGTTLVEAAVERMRAQGRSTLLVATAAADVDNLRLLPARRLPSAVGGAGRVLPRDRLRGRDEDRRNPVARSRLARPPARRGDVVTHAGTAAPSSAELAAVSRPGARRRRAGAWRAAASRGRAPPSARADPRGGSRAAGRGGGGARRGCR